jgi:hypothetical protein
MPTDQRNAWTALIVTALFVIYLLANLRSSSSLDLLLIVPVLVAVAIVMRTLLRLGETKGRDERDRSIATLSIRNAHYVLLAAIGMLVFCIIPAGLVDSVDQLARLLAGAFALSELARYASQVLYYRRL